jgi:hypothetical protein
MIDEHVEQISVEDLEAIKSAKNVVRIAELELNNLILRIFIKYGLKSSDTIDENTRNIFRDIK